MLSRHIIRSKTLQAVYSFVVGGETSIEKGRKALIASVEDMRELALLQLSALLELRDIAERKIEENKNKWVPMPEDLNPNLNFINNKIFTHIANNTTLQNELKALRNNWADMNDSFRKLYKTLLEWGDYKKYMSESADSFDVDRLFVAKTFKKFIAFNSDIRDYFEEKNIHWGDDSAITGLIVHAWLKSYNTENPDTVMFPTMFKPAEGIGNDDDKDFMIKLYDKTILNFDKFDEIIGKHLKNWEFERIITIDVLIIKMALTEITLFQNIPIKASLNEYIDLSKEFGTPKSNSFVNGLLDKIIQDLQSENKIVKTGRGLG